MDSLLLKGRERKGLYLTLAGLLPLLLCLVFTGIEATQIIQRQQAVTAEMLLNQSEAISDHAWKMIAQLQQFSGKPCEEINDRLQRFSAIYPYFRSVGTIQHDTITCSSAFGSKQGNITILLQRPPPENRRTSWVLSLAGTYSVRDRPAVIFVRDGPEGSSSFALVDGQYLHDFMNAVGKSHGYRIAIQFGGGFRITRGNIPSAGEGFIHANTYTATSKRYPIVVSVTSPPADTAYTWRQGLYTFLPMALILSLLLMTVTSNWLKRRLSYGDLIRRAIARDEFSVNYQPLFNLETNRYGGAEASMRWQLPDGRWAKPDRFISAAESEGMIVPLTRHLLTLIIRDVQHWHVPPGFHLGINVAAEHLQHPDFVQDIRGFAAQLAAQKLNITLELTERSLISDGDDVVKKLHQLRAEGIHIAIDDFGTGHCALSYLQTFPLDYLKVDRGFVNAIEFAGGEAPILDAIINLSQKLGLKIVAEGVETPVQLDYLKARGVIHIQGYLFAHPMTSSALMAWLQSTNPAPPYPL